MTENQAFAEEELYEHFKFIAGSGQSPLRVDKFLMNSQFIQRRQFLFLNKRKI